MLLSLKRQLKDLRHEPVFWLVATIVLVASFLRLFQLTFHDPLTDEVLYGFRSIGLIDYVAAYTQTTPWQWYSQVPWWAHISFHDHPIFFFLVQHVFLNVFGETVFAFRLPAALAGIGSVIVMFLLGKRYAGKKAGIIAAVILAVQSHHLWVSRIGLQDGFVIFLMLFCLLLFDHALENKKWFPWWGVLLGLAILTKYTTLILIPMCLVQALLYKKSIWSNRAFWKGALLAMIIMLPIIVYNVALYKAEGHFDFQVSAALSQDVQEWSHRMGREQVGGFSDRFRNFFVGMHQASSPLFSFLAVVSILFAFLGAWKNSTHRREIIFGLSLLFLMWVWFLAIGFTFRFIVMIIPFFAISIAAMLTRLMKDSGVLYFAVGVVLLFELFFSYNTLFAKEPIGPVDFTYGSIRSEVVNKGFNELSDYVDELLAGKVTALFGEPEFQFLTDLHTSREKEAKEAGAIPTPLMIIFDHDLDFIPTLWVLQRHLIYDGWPVIPDDLFYQITGTRYEEFYKKQGIDEFVYVVSANESVRRPAFERKLEDPGLVDYLQKKGVTPDRILDAQGNHAFDVYRF